ncbi:hypothetical protein [Paenarthrobacter sp. NPDC089316]|uniref:hypothetical protein n=1 Tax=unclassified Paenarthrobacter TaxID=2634190 RepID=UPI003440FC3B
MHGITGPRVPSLTTDARPVGCIHCGTSKRVAITSIESLPPHQGELHVRVGYLCQTCQANYEHVARFRDVAATLNRKESFDGLLRFAGEYFHCGEPMPILGTNTKSIYAPLSTELPPEETPAVNVGTKVLRCQCGFQLELPA